MSLEDVIKILILFIIFIAFIIWLLYYVYSIRLSNRIKNTTIKSKKIDKNSIVDNLIYWYQNEKEKISKNILKHNIDYKQNQKSISTIIDTITTIIILIFVYLFLCLFYLNKPSITVILLLFLIGLLLPNIISIIVSMIRRKEIENNLLKIITLINNGISSGKSIRESVISATNKLEGSSKNELELVVNDLDHGLSLEVAFKRMEKRTNVKDIIYLTSTLSMLNKTGGNAIIMFNYLEKIFKTRKKLDQELNATIASSKLVFIIMAIMPIIVFVGMMFLYDNYIKLFMQNSLGTLILMIIFLLYIVYVYVIQKIMKIEKY